MKKILPLILIFFTISSSFGQDNIAPDARASCSDPWNWQNINNKDYSTCGTQTAFVWTSTNPTAFHFMLWEWTSIKVIGSMKIWHANLNNRFLAGGTIERWDGSRWVVHQRFSNLVSSNCENEIKFDVPMVTDKMRIIDFQYGPGQTSNPNFREIEIYAFTGDAQMMNVDFFSGGFRDLCYFGEYPVDVTIRNNGPGILGPIDVKVEVDGGGGAFIETVDMMDVPAGQSKTVRMNTLVRASRLGSVNIKATIMTQDIDLTNNEVTRSRVTLNTPTGSEIKPTATYPGFAKQGTLFEKDIITYGKKFVYEITPPNKYTNNTHGSSWISRFTITKDGSPLPGSRYNYIAPSGSSNARLELDLWEDDVESEILVNFRVTDVGGNGCDTLATRYIYVAPMPKPDFDGLQVCLGNGLQFVNKSTINTGVMSYVWTFGDGVSSTLFEPNYKYTTVGSYSVKLVATSNLGFVDSVSSVISVDPTPVPDFSFKNQCGSLPVAFENLTSISSGSLMFDWDFGDGQSSSDVNPHVTYAKAGPYTVTLFVESDNGCFATVSKSAYSYPQPKADFLLPDGVCVGTQIALQNATTIDFSNWGSEWMLPGGVRTLTRSPRYTFEQSGPSEIKLRITSQFGCVDSVTKILDVLAGPFIQLTHTDICVGAPVNFMSNVVVPAGMNVDYLWNIDGEIFGDPTPVMVFNSPGSKNVFVDIQYANGCNSRAQMQVEAGYRPTTVFNLGDAICSNVEMKLENLTTTQFDLPEYKWFMGDGSTYTSFAPRHIYNVNQPTPFKVMLVSSGKNGACPDTMTKDIIVGLIPSCSFTVEETYLPGHRAFRFVADDAAASYRWSFGNGQLSSESTPVYQYIRDGQFEVKLQLTSQEGCVCESKQMLSVINLNTNNPTLENASFTVYPNPSSGLFQIQYHGISPITSVKVFNTVGALIYDGNNIMVDLTGHASGVYQIKALNQSGEQFNTKVILQ